MVTQIRESDLTKVAELVKIDTRNRVHLPKVLVRKGIRYNIYSSSDGQIILVPQVTVPASESWLFKNPDILALAQRGLSDAAEGRVSRINLDTL